MTRRACLLPLLASCAIAGILAGCGGSTNSAPAGTTNPPAPAATLSATSIALGSASVGAPVTFSSQPVTLTNTGTGSLSISSITITGTNATSFSQTNTCGAALAAGAACAITPGFSPATVGSLSAAVTIADSAAGSPQTIALTGMGVAGPILTYSLNISSTSLTFPATTVGLSSPAQTLTFTNTGIGPLSLTSVVVSGTNAGYFNETATTCGASLTPASSCTASIVFTPGGSGAATALFTVTDTAANSPQTITLTGTGTAQPTALNIADCSVSTGPCTDTFTTANLASDPIAAGGFHGYADPSERKDPNSSSIYYAYSWAHTLADGTHVVDLHLAQSNDNGATFTYVGPLYQSTQTTQTGSMAYSSVNDSSTETIDLLPIPLTGVSAGQTLWVQAHQSYLVAPQTAIYNQLNVTGLISVSAVQLTNPGSAGAGTALLALGSPTTPEARLGVTDTDATRNVTTNLATLAPAASKCGNFGQSALWYQAGTLYLALECTEITGGGNIDANELSHFLFTTTPSGTDASKWTWSYAGIFLTEAVAAKLGTVEGMSYTFFTEPEFALTRSGQLVLIATPSVFAPQTAQQPVVQYGCRTIPVASLSPTGITLDTDATTGAPVVTSRITENDLYTSPNEGPAACTYEPAANNGIIMGRKFENDPTLGFYLYPVNTLINP